MTHQPSKLPRWWKERAMMYRLAALPRSWVNTDVCMLEDRVGRLYQYDPDSDILERLDTADANLLMQWYELSQSFTWHERDDLSRIFATASNRADRLANSTC
jgi:hypothetical protein